MQNENADLTVMMAQLRSKYIEHVRQRCPDIAAFVSICERGGATVVERNAMRFHAHGLAGSGTTYGFSDISKAGRILEKALDADSSEQELLPLARTLYMLCCQAVLSEGDRVNSA